MNKKVTVIGNSGIAEILACILQMDYEIVKVTDLKDPTYEMPYYPNDINHGILRQFMEDAGIEYKDIFEKQDVTIKLMTSESYLEFSSDFHSFQSALQKKVSNKEKEIQGFFAILEKLGYEWKSQIGGKFQKGADAFRYSGKYGLVEMKDIQEKFGLPAIVEEYLNAFLPVDDETVPLYGGYIYTQLFDINAIGPKLMEFIYEKSKAKIKYELIEDIYQVQAETCEGTFVIDCRNNKESDQKGGRIKLRIEGSEINKKDVFYIKNEKVWMHIWNQSILSKESDHAWEMEYVLFDQQMTSEDVIEIAQGKLGLRLTCIEEWPDSKLYKMFDATEIDGFGWAFNKKKIMRDPMNMVKKHKGRIIQCNHWGYAWFLAGYHIRCLITDRSKI